VLESEGDPLASGSINVNAGKYRHVLSCG